MNAKAESLWLLFITSLPGQSGTPRIRLWRALKGLGAAVVRDGVYLLPWAGTARQALEEQAHTVRALNGIAYVLDVQTRSDQEEREFRALFNRAAEYEELNKAIVQFRTELHAWTEPQARRALKSLRREFDNLGDIDYFPGLVRQQTSEALQEAEAAILQRFAPDEPTASQRKIERLDKAHYQGRRWATRRRLWIDRVASAWLIRRFIDPHARFIWLANATDCPPEAMGFDFDGATFTHVGRRVTFEVLITSFGLDRDAGLARIAELVHYLDVGGPAVSEATGFEAILTGARERCQDDDRLLAEMTPVLDCLYAAFAPISA
jgi:hypothetical protein